MRPTILVAEDDNLMLLTVTNMLEFMGYRTIDAHTQETALGMLAGIWFDTILMSSTAADPDGRIFASMAKGIQPHIKTLVISGLGKPEHMPPNVDAVLAKPFSLDDINFAVRTLLRKASFSSTTYNYA